MGAYARRGDRHSHHVDRHRHHPPYLVAARPDAGHARVKRNGRVMARRHRRTACEPANHSTCSGAEGSRAIGLARPSMPVPKPHRPPVEPDRTAPRPRARRNAERSGGVRHPLADAVITHLYAVTRRHPHRSTANQAGPCQSVHPTELALAIPARPAVWRTRCWRRPGRWSPSCP